MKQLRLVLGPEPEAEPSIAFKPEVLARPLARLVDSILEVHKAEGGRSDDGCRTHPRITPQQLVLQAIVYLRQSSGRQVRQNLESQRLQYGLGDRARLLGFRHEYPRILFRNFPARPVSAIGLTTQVRDRCS